MERVRGIEPLSSAWKAEVMPLYDTRLGPNLNLKHFTFYPCFSQAQLEFKAVFNVEFLLSNE